MSDRPATNVRYAYIKNGDAVAQVRRVLGLGRYTGPDAIIGGFLAARQRDEVVVLCRSRPEERFEAGRVVVKSLPGPFATRVFLSRIIAAARVVAHAIAWQPDRILCGSGREVLWLAVAAARLWRIPVVVARHTGMPPRRGLDRLSYTIESLFLRLCDGVVCHGAFLAESVRAAGVDPERVFEFDVDLRGFVADSSAAVVPGGLSAFVTRFPLVVMYVGRIQRSKGVFDLLEAYGTLSGPTAQRTGLVFVGDGEDLERLREIASAAGMSERVLLMGRTSHQCLPAVMRCATAIATPTRPPLQEGRCMVVAEALVVGVPVVAPSFAAFPYSVRDGVNGLLYAPGEVNALASCIEQLASDPALCDRLRHGAKASGRALLDGNRDDFVSAVEAAFDRWSPRGQRLANVDPGAGKCG